MYNHFSINMYIFKIKDNTPDINILVSRCLLILASVGALAFRSNQPFLINIVVAILLLLSAICINILLKKFSLDRRWPFIIGSFLLLVATHSIIVSAILLLFDFIIKKLYRQPEVTINTTGVTIKKMLSNNLHLWVEFNNIILKDNLLSLDFKDNKLWQLNLKEDGEAVDENSFNNFCSKFIGE